eukprot:TRINITY_DN5109_c0_g1_i1.p2 TRINITY_DN5109_c0_g1~~TRINITY_DN5109_c0_g1_i1.p2  ORF type:complete len:135 (+),score=24.10 TRINITY_DN5109_c0_g1_i1:280-684(+)
MKKCLKKLVINLTETNKQLMSLFSVILPQYELQSYQQYSNCETSGLIFANETDLQLQTQFHSIKSVKDKSSYQKLYELIKYEILEISAFLDAIQQKESIEQQIQKANSRIKSFSLDLQKLSSGKSTLKLSLIHI